ncbi:MAG TPA: ABC transporter ATP-binding protein [Gaiellaceae bacterium]|nr:ABC transporter ATP-binding protein [Gaiellaceae bacterium]
MNGPLLSAKGVSRRYGRIVALAPTSLEVHARDALALIGPNGAGKSTLLSILAGALDPSGGSVSGASPRIGWVPQKPAHYQRLSPRENLELFARLERVPEPKDAANRYMSLLDLPDDGRLTAELSAGNQQRLNLAVALLAGPDVLLLDEPTASLDPRQRRILWEVAAAVREREGAVVFATQNLEELERFATRVAALVDGELVFDGSLEQFKASPEADVFA